jgi:outer membrane protein assembly factor BamB
MTALRLVHCLAGIALLGATLAAQTDGKLRWGSQTDVNGHGLIDSSPAILFDGTDTTIFVGVERETTPLGGALIAFNSSGGIKWSFDTLLDAAAPVDSAVNSSPAISADGSTVYFGSKNGKFYALNIADFTKKWEFNAHADVYTSPTLGPDGTVYIVTGDFILHALSKDNGSEKWHHAAGYGLDPSPAVAPDGTIYFGTLDGNLVALNPDASEKWTTPAGALVYASPAIASDGTVYFTSYSDGRLLAVSPEGVVKWTFSASGVIAASPSLGADGTIYFGDGNGNFYALNPDRTPKWAKPASIGAPIVSTAAVRADGTIIVGAYDYRLHALNPDGTEKWKTAQTGDQIFSSPVIAPDGTIYVGSEDGKLYSFSGSGAPLSTVSTWPMFHRDGSHSARSQATTAGGYLVNLSTYAQAGGGSNLIAGFVVRGSATKRFLIRAVGPSLAQFNVPNPLADPAVTLVSAGTEIAANDNWSSTFENSLSVISATQGVTFQLGSGEKDAALVAALAPANYTAVVTSADGGTGVALVEAYDLEVSAPAARLINISTRAQSGSGANVLTAGLVIGGPGTLRLLVRAVGPGLAQFGVSGFLTQPVMRVFSGQTEIGRNIGWTSGGLTEDLAVAARLTGAFTLPTGSADCAAVLTLAPGNYTIQVSGVGGTTGEALVEVYVVP